MLKIKLEEFSVSDLSEYYSEQEEIIAFLNKIDREAANAASQNEIDKEEV